MTNLNSFKAYDVRGRIPDEINESLAYDIGRAYCTFVKPHRVAVGYDIRLSSQQLAAALKRGLLDSGCDVLDTGLQQMRALIESQSFPPKAAKPGVERPLDLRKKYLEHLLSYVDRTKLRQL